MLSVGGKQNNFLTLELTLLNKTSICATIDSGHRWLVHVAGMNTDKNQDDCIAMALWFDARPPL